MKKNTIILADLDELIFEGRNKNYGGYVIRKDANKNLATGLGIVALLLSILVILNFALRDPNNGPNTEAFIPTIIDNFKIKEIEIPEKKEEIEEIEEVKEEVKKETQAQGVTETKFDNLKPSTEASDTATIVAADSIKGNPSDRDMLGNDSTGVMGNRADSSGTGLDKPIDKQTGNGSGDPDINKVFLDLEETPSAQNMDWLKQEMGYPRAATEIGIEGKVIFRILVDKNGNYKKHKTIYSSHKIFEKHVEPHLKKLKFNPGIQAGHSVPVWVNIPFKFNFQR